MENEVLIVKNITREGPGLLKEVLEERNIPYSIVDLHKGETIPSITNYAALVVLGGPDSANDENEKMRDELALIRQAYKAGIPYLGICLGLQTLVKALGGNVTKGEVREVGFRDPDDNFFTIELTDKGACDPLFAGLESPLRVFHLHGETVELADNMTLLASGKFCTNQVVKVGEHAYGIQCHFELTPEMFEVWVREDPDLQALPADQLHKDYAMIKDTYTNTGRRLLQNFLAIANM